jgi:hypothetical protein
MVLLHHHLPPCPQGWIILCSSAILLPYTTLLLCHLFLLCCVSPIIQPLCWVLSPLFLCSQKNPTVICDVLACNFQPCFCILTHWLHQPTVHGLVVTSQSINHQQFSSLVFDQVAQMYYQMIVNATHLQKNWQSEPCSSVLWKYFSSSSENIQ